MESKKPMGRDEGGRRARAGASDAGGCKFERWGKDQLDAMTSRVRGEIGRWSGARSCDIKREKRERCKLATSSTASFYATRPRQCSHSLHSDGLVATASESQMMWFWHLGTEDGGEEDEEEGKYDFSFLSPAPLPFSFFVCPPALLPFPFLLPLLPRPLRFVACHVRMEVEGERKWGSIGGEGEGVRSMIAWSPSPSQGVPSSDASLACSWVAPSRQETMEQKESRREVEVGSR
jgi:hypothetical protein